MKTDTLDQPDLKSLNSTHKCVYVIYKHYITVRYFLKQLDISHIPNRVDTLSVCNYRNLKVIFLFTSRD